MDRDVRGKPGVKSIHAHGAAIDINPKENPMGPQLITDMPEGVFDYAQSLGMGWGGKWSSIKDAMHFSMAKHEGGSIPLMADGGITHGPAVVGEAGPEAVIPLKSGRVPVDLGSAADMLKSVVKSAAPSVSALEQEFTSAIKTMTSQINKPRESQERILELLKELQRINSNTADITAKIARASLQ